MIVLYSLLLYWCPSLWELKGTVLTDETSKNSVEAGWHLLYTKEQLQKQRRIERQWGYFRCSGFETQGTKALGTRCEFSFEKLSSGGETLGKCFFNKRPCFYIFFLLCFWSIPALNSSFWDRLPGSIICVPVLRGNCMQTLQLRSVTSSLAQILELSSSTELCRSNPTPTQVWESLWWPSLSFLHEVITCVCIPVTWLSLPLILSGMSLRMLLVHLLVHGWSSSRVRPGCWGFGLVMAWNPPRTKMA